MRRFAISVRRQLKRGLPILVALVVLVSVSQAQQTFPSPARAADALAAVSVKNGTNRAVRNVLGPAGKEIIALTG